MIETLDRVPDVKVPAKPRPKKLTRLRRVWRRSRRYLLLGVMAFTLSFGLVAVPVVKAEADLLSAATIAEINGAMRMPLTQVVVGAIRTHPVGFALVGVGALALYAYTEREQWMPFVTGLFGQADPNVPNSSGVTGAEPGYTVAGATLTGNTILANYKYKASQPGQFYTQGWTSIMSSIGKCKRTSDGYVAYYLYEATRGVTGRAADFDVSYNLFACPTGYTTLGYIVGGGGGDPASGRFEPKTSGATGSWAFSGNSTTASGTHGTENVMKYGDLAPEGFDPRGEGTNYVTSAECIDSAGNKSIIEYTSKGTDGMLRMPPCAEMVPGSHGTGKMWVDGYAPGSTVPTRLYDVDPMTDPDHPLCSPTRPGSGCLLGVSIDGKPCVIGDVQCENWTEIRRDDQTGARVSCNYGPYAVGVEQCNILERAYQIGGAPATEENIDGNPDTAKWSQPNGDPWKPKPQPEPGTGTNTSTLPTTGTNPGATPGESGENCLSQGWSWNPVSWVMVPTQCALQWAFVPPKLKVETTLQTLQPRLEARGITPFVTPFMGSLSSLGGSGCSGPPIDLSVVHLPVFYPFSACADPMDKIASGVSSFFALSLVVQGGMSCIRGVAAAFGFNWGLGSSKTEDGS